MVHLRSFGRHFLFYFIVNLMGLSLFTFFRFSILENFVGDIDLQQRITEFGQFKFVALTTILLSASISFVTSLVDILIFKRLHFKLPFGAILLIELPVQIGIIILVWQTELEFIQQMLVRFTHGNNISADAPPGTEFIIVLLFVHIAIGRLLIALDRKLGHGNIWKIIFGRFYSPREDVRIFMFIDLKDSATIAEKLGHMKFSQFIKSCFSDLSVVDRYRAEIYQFVGDEVVLTWCNPNGLKNNNYLKAFYAFKNKLKERQQYYLDTFGMEPFFKAGAHTGLVVTTEVGDLKREISYHGDTINTAARIQGLCNENNAELLISADLYKITEDKKGYKITDLGLKNLKGKNEDVGVHKIEKL